MTIVSWMSSTTAGTSMGSDPEGPDVDEFVDVEHDMPGISIRSMWTGPRGRGFPVDVHQGAGDFLMLVGEADRGDHRSSAVAEAAGAERAGADTPVRSRRCCAGVTSRCWDIARAEAAGAGVALRLPVLCNHRIGQTCAEIPHWFGRPFRRYRCRCQRSSS